MAVDHVKCSRQVCVPCSLPPSINVIKTHSVQIWAFYIYILHAEYFVSLVLLATCIFIHFLSNEIDLSPLSFSNFSNWFFKAKLASYKIDENKQQKYEELVISWRSPHTFPTCDFLHSNFDRHKPTPMYVQPIYYIRLLMLTYCRIFPKY